MIAISSVSFLMVVKLNFELGKEKDCLVPAI